MVTRPPSARPAVDPSCHRRTCGQCSSTLRLGAQARPDLEAPGNREFFWYRSEENGENRRGERSVDIGVERETFIDVAGTARRLYDFLRGLPADDRRVRFLLEEPEHSVGVTACAAGRRLALQRGPRQRLRCRLSGQ